jgi:signal transduction histidine kinase/CheY-like chemotaxis protein
VRIVTLLLVILQFCFANIKEIVVTHNINNPPFKFVNEQGNPDGILIDIWRLWEQKTGTKVTFFPASFEDSLRYIQQGNADVHAGVFHTQDREAFLSFTRALLDLNYYYFFDKTIQPTYSNDGLQSYVIGVPLGFTHHYMQQHHNSLYTKTFKDLPMLYQTFVQKGIKVFVSPIENYKYFLSKYDLKNSAFVDEKRPLFQQSYLGAVKLGNQALLEHINKGLEQISAQEIENIKNSWFDKYNKQLRSEELILTHEEKEWLAAHRVIKVGVDASWQPFDYVNAQNEHLGIASEYLRYIKDRLNIDIQIVSGVWSDVLQKAKNKEIDILACAANTPQRREFLHFTNEYLNIKTVIITQTSNNDVFHIDNLQHKSVAIAKGNFVQDLLKTQYPLIKLQLYDSNEEALKAVSLGKADAHIGNLATATFFIEKNMLSNLKIVSQLEDFTHKLSIAVREDWEILRNIIQKVLFTINDEQKEKFYTKWVKFDKPIINYDLVWKVSLLFVVIIGLALFRVRRQKQIIRQKEAHQQELLHLQKELEIALEKAKEATKAKSDFLSNMSHEIRTPMNSILGFTEILTQEIQNHTHQNYLKSIKTASKTLLGIINDILDLSKIEAGKLNLSYSAINLNRVIEECEAIFSEKLQQKGLYMKFELDSSLPSYVLIDELRFRQILLNLISNAIKFTHEGGITITSRVDFTEPTHSTFNLILSVKDTGIGIQKEYLSKIFDYFEQVNDETQFSASNGSGLGLAICTKIINLMNGSIGVESEVGKGSTFYITFNELHVSSAKTISQEEQLCQENFKFENAVILIVDDIADNRKLIALFFANTAIEIIQASNGVEALEVLQQRHDINLVLLDIKMPLMNGYETIDAIKNKLKLTMPVVALTASVMGEDSQKIQEYQFDGYLRKPVSQVELFKEVSKFLPHTLINHETKNTPQNWFEQIQLNHNMLQNTQKTQKELDALLQECQSIKNRGDFSLIEAFVKILYDFAQEYEHEQLKNFCTTLTKEIESFEISSVQILMNEFEKIAQHLSKEIRHVQKI